MLSFLYNYKISILKGDFKDGDSSNLQVSTAKRYIQNVESKIISLKFRYSKTDKANNIYRGFRKKTPSNISKSTVIPLKFNAQIDGIGGLVIGNVFKIKKEFLPKGYDGEDIAFAIMTENQKITAGQDWTTDFSGQMLLLDLPKKDDWDDIFPQLSEANTTGGRPNSSTGITVNADLDDEFRTTLQQQIPDPNIAALNSGAVYLKVPKANVRTTPYLDITFGGSPFDWNDNLIGTFSGNQGDVLGTILTRKEETYKDNTIEVTSGKGDLILSNGDKSTLGWSTITKEGVTYELVNENIEIETSHTIGKYDNKWYIPEGVEWSFKKDTDWIWFKIEFTPEMLTKLNLDSGNDSLINGNQGWMREDVLCTENYTTPQ